jgi:branched-chain amino acid transport system permease protein
MHMKQSAIASNKPVNWLWLVFWAAILAYLPVVLTERALFGIPLTNTQLLNLGLTQINLMLISMLGALSLNYLTGCAGLISIGHAAFFATGAMAAAIFDNQLGLPFPLVLLACGLAGALVGTLAGLPSLRVRGLYFVLSTLAVHYVVSYVFLEYQFKFFDVVGIPYAAPHIGDFELNTPVRWYAFLLPLVILVYLGLKASLQSREGLAMRAMRDHELAATAMGVDVRILRLKAFGLSSAIASVAGALFAYYLTNVTSEAFNISFAIQFIAMIIIGGMGSLPGAVVAGLLVGVVFAMTSLVAPEYAELSIFVLMAVVLLWRPQGFFGKAGLMS